METIEIAWAWIKIGSIGAMSLAVTTVLVLTSVWLIKTLKEDLWK